MSWKITAQELLERYADIAIISFEEAIVEGTLLENKSRVVMKTI